ncbi:IMP dehydrogenase [Candidatus Nomurabacteria bacterium RIFCSPLOWO2_01_FULL_39_18]|uniref:Inosine-5'-monophosphate dehydrogenase n=1 Tax=Candidatus Nomurabacteria bacterium RIFCSPHIGHO2_01_FULL_40_24b TaxID=1801739 RepID=A0A1F6V6D4_9BACT|nr:MAG: IMP dehydrogenase [Candidatus Nomurabacteria bacterium RIFCSPHIGHO2_01_FULL_40_24b]OGI89221.1 MAG: IMP dehydrogenase [Candidatus Nomurabacteria bacterium RIFCSPLOWO2_01_FULL_39_18]
MAVKKSTTKNTPRNLGQGLTFDDVLLVPNYSEVLPKNVTTKTRLTKNISLNIPFMSAPMDTVTEAPMAIAMAQQGGIGIIHKNLSIVDQAKEVERVKRYEAGRIANPVTLSVGQTVGDAFAIQKKYHFGGFPVLNKNGVLVGIVTNRDLRFQKNESTPIEEVMTTKLITGGPNTSIEEANDLFNKHAIEKLPLVDKNNKLVGLITYRDIAKSKEYPNATKDTLGRLRVGATVGVGKDVLQHVKALVNSNVDIVCVETAHGHSRGVLDAVKRIRKAYPKLDIIAGNIATGEAARTLIDAGTNAVKVGIGPGSICTTRVVSGVGVPQLSAVSAVYEVCKKLNIPVIADGGIKHSGDVVKALVFGADVVMGGSMFAGTDESPGDTIAMNDQKFKKYRGMGSLGAMQRGSKDRYFQGDEYDMTKLVPEGVSGHVAYKGALSEVIHQFVGGLRAGMGYLGAETISKLRNASYYTITSAGLNESHIHDIFMVKPSPNYKK